MKIVSVNGDRVLIKEQEDSKKTTGGGIIVPDSVKLTEATGLQKHITTGTVIRLGQDCSSFKEGESVLFAIADSALIEYGEIQYRVIRESALVFAFEGDKITRLNTDRVLIEADPMDKVTKTGLLIPENATYEPTTGTVLWIGDKCKEFKVGYRVLFGKAAVAIDLEKPITIQEYDS
jgi:co-chaperonin GroES (HSP10)